MVLNRKLPSQTGEQENKPAEEAMEASVSPVSETADDADYPKPELPPLPPDFEEDVKQKAAPTPPPFFEEESASDSKEEFAAPPPFEEEESQVKEEEPTSQGAEAPIAPPSFEEKEPAEEKGEEEFVGSPEFAAPPAFGEGDSPWGAAPGVNGHAEIENTLSKPSEASGDWSVETIPEPQVAAGESGFVPPWEAGDIKPAELPGGQKIEKKESGRKEVAMPGFEPEGENSIVSRVIMLGIAGVMVFGAYVFLSGNEHEGAERIARMTGELKEVPEKLPENVSETEAAGMLAPEEIVTMEDASETGMMEIAMPVEQKAEPEKEGLTEEQRLSEIAEFEKEAKAEPVEAKEPQTKEEAEQKTEIAFIDVPDEEVEKLITGEEAEEMPEELSLLASFQKALNKARSEKEDKAIEEGLETEKKEIEPSTLSDEEKEVMSQDMVRKVDEELAAYRRALVRGAKPVSPNKFFDQKQTEQAEVVESVPVPKPQPKKATQTAQAQELPAYLYGANPKNLPVAPEPSGRPQKGVRTLNEFDVSMFEPKEKRVRIPKGIRPSFRASDFPPMTLLSLVPGYGLIARLEHKEGVLLIGESVQGWELLGVSTGYAEFSNGYRKHTVRLR